MLKPAAVHTEHCILGLGPQGRGARLALSSQHLPLDDMPTPGYLVLDIYLHVGYWQRALQTVLPILLGMRVQECVIHLQRRHTVTPVLAMTAAASSIHNRSLGTPQQRSKAML